MDLISVTRKDNLAFATTVRGHQIVTDLIEKEGGADEGPSPVELMGFALGSCIALMVQKYSLRHDWKGDAEVNLTLELADNPKRIGRIVVDLELPEGVPDDQKAALRRVAELCPVHETLRNAPQVDIEIS